MSSQNASSEQQRRERRQQRDLEITEIMESKSSALWETSRLWILIGLVPIILSVILGIKVGTDSGFWFALLTAVVPFSIGLLIVAISCIAAAYAITYVPRRSRE